MPDVDHDIDVMTLEAVDGEAQQPITDGFSGNWDAVIAQVDWDSTWDNAVKLANGVTVWGKITGHVGDEAEDPDSEGLENFLEDFPEDHPEDRLEVHRDPRFEEKLQHMTLPVSPCISSQAIS